ncbi:glycosyltransferase family 32 protein [Oidiodendron maius Zn]|uniref:Glycosyltransferase family 32 protein n=1 Tax=Oidiodendron maius (strain Zn) TaxID=913774 RepID=A0A0C3HSM1_OIDMZ|nr:glycosyltransferase family 32 protein [Oidiodendron maius Zn]
MRELVHGAVVYQEDFPLTWKHAHMARGKGGAWYIPPHWLRPSDPRPKNIIEAARLASRRAISSSHTLSYSTIPQIIHQKWKNTTVDTWPRAITDGIERWLSYAMVENDNGMAHMLWWDDGCDELIRQVNPELVDSINALPLPVEKYDVFRMVALNTYGGIYADVDTTPLRTPRTWLDETDILPWSDPQTGAQYSSNTSSHPIQLILGIEGDNPPDTNTYWRMGYNFPVQLTQWALASAPGHPIINRFLTTFAKRMQQLAKPYNGNLTLAASAGAFNQDPLSLTGPEAITVATMGWLEENSGLRWNALTGLEDGGRSKAIGDTMILPITGISPGRGKFGNMGSKPITDPSARLVHNGQGSWKTFDLKVEFGKICRMAFGRCRDWSKVPIK